MTLWRFYGPEWCEGPDDFIEDIGGGVLYGRSRSRKLVLQLGGPLGTYCQNLVMTCRTDGETE